VRLRGSQTSESEMTDRGIGEGDGEMDEQPEVERRYELSGTPACGCRYAAASVSHKFM